MKYNKMKLLPACFLLTLFVALVAGCGGKQASQEPDDSLFDSLALVADTTVYGVCGEGTSMHNLQLVTDMGDTLNYLVNVDDSAAIMGGLMAGDRLALIGGRNLDGDVVASFVVNITSLMGRWTSIDRNFELCEGGAVRSSLTAEQHPWATWKILNGQLLLDADTFSIVQLGPDSLGLENHEGIYMYKRQNQ